MKRSFVATLAFASLTIPLMAVAQGGSTMGGTPGTPGGSMMGNGTSMMGDHRGAQSMPASRSMAAMSEGEVRKVDSTAGKLTLRHGPLMNMDMPPMTMVFRVKDPAWLTQLKVGDKVRFVAERVDGNLTVTALEPERQ